MSTANLDSKINTPIIAKTKRVVLLQGGLGAEREVSIATGRGFESALKELGYPYVVVDCREDLLAQLMVLKNSFEPQVALLALHGKFAEDGIVQSICEYVRLPYSGSGVLASALCMDKLFSKQILENNNVPVPPYQSLHVREIPQFKLTLEYPVVVKPSREGSSVGISVVKNPGQLQEALMLAAQYDSFLLIEKFIDGMELTVPILNHKVLTPIEIVPKEDFYHYQNKYTSGKTDYYLPARLDSETMKRAKDLALKAFDLCRLRCYGRVDFRVDAHGVPHVLELNTLPGCTPTSLLPKAAADCGIGFNQMIEILIETASLDYAGVK